MSDREATPLGRAWCNRGLTTHAMHLRLNQYVQPESALPNAQQAPER